MNGLNRTVIKHSFGVSYQGIVLIYLF